MAVGRTCMDDVFRELQRVEGIELSEFGNQAIVFVINRFIYVHFVVDFEKVTLASTDLPGIVRTTLLAYASFPEQGEPWWVHFVKNENNVEKLRGLRSPIFVEVTSSFTYKVFVFNITSVHVFKFATCLYY